MICFLTGNNLQHVILYCAKNIYIFILFTAHTVYRLYVIDLMLQCDVKYF